MSQNANDTRVALLEAACNLFSEKGFRGTTVAEICRSARANIAAVNYHFGSKAALYKQAWQHARRAALEAYPPHGGVSPNAPAEQRLRGHIRAMLQRASSQRSLQFRMMRHEMANPTGLLKGFRRDAIGPFEEAVRRVVRELIGAEADNGTVDLCVMCVIGPCLHLARWQRRRMRMGKGPKFDPRMCEEMVEGLATFALAGIEAIKTSRRAKPAPRAGKGAQK